MEYYLRVEGVNLSNFVYDTNDLPTIRGGGLLLLDAIAGVSKKLDEITDHKEEITQGASWGLFRFTPKPNKNQEEVKKDIVSFLNGNDTSHKGLRYSTFVVDVLPVETNNFVKCKNKLAALNHWQQMSAPSLAIAKKNKKVCGLTKVLPASENDFVGDVFISKSVKARRKYSKDQKRKLFYTNRINTNTTINPDLLTFTSHFGELSSDRKQQSLHHKMAVIYIDGNKFGNFQTKHCKNEQMQHRFDTSVRDGQNKILESVLEAALIDTTASWKTDTGKIRLETLLWGGDEIIWVVPAWLGLPVLDIFYTQAEEKIIFIEDKPELKGKKKRRAKKNKQPKTIQVEHQLKHAAGLVFCHHKAPIHRVIHLAKELAELAKKETNDNLFTYQVLESFDHAGKHLEEWRNKRIENLGDAKALFISPADIEHIKNCILQLKTQRSPEFPKRKIYQIIKTLKNGDTEKYTQLWKKLDKTHQEILSNLKEKFHDSDVMWLHLVDLWDYAGGAS